LASTGKKVLIIVQNLPVPFDRRVWLEATTLQQNGYDVSVICPKKYGYNKSHEVLEGVHIFRYPLVIEGNRSPFAFLLEFTSCFAFTAYLSVRVLFSVGFDVIHICNPPETYFPLAFFYKILRKKIIFDHHDLSPEMFIAKGYGASKDSFFYRLLVLMEKLTFKVADAVITTNESHKRVAMERGKKRCDRIFVVRSGPDMERFSGFAYDGRLKEGKEFLVCYLGEMCEQDGVGIFLRELSSLDSKFLRESVHFAFIGKGPAQADLAKEAEALSLWNVRFTGRVTDLELANYLSTADLCIDTSPYSEWADRSTMNKIIEYMAFSRPVLSFDLTESIRTLGDRSLVAKPGDYEDFFSKIVSILGDADLRIRVGTSNRKRFLDALSWRYSVPNLLKAYDAVFV
jgi:glycosyltransferase involved in cell wall biosynthesis